jgi:hypothetical protein
MALNKGTLRQKLESILDSRPGSTPDAATDWANAYLEYASLAMSSQSSLPVAAAASLGLLVGAFTGAFQAMSSSAAAALIAQGVQGFWTTQVWVGPAVVGTTAFPGNLTLASELASIFADTAGTNADKAGRIADAFDTGAKTVMVSDVTPVTTIVGPIT